MIQSYTIKGRVVQFGNNKPLDKVKVSYSTFITYTNKRGIYKLPIKIEVNDKGEVAEKFSFLLSYIIGPSVLNDIILTFGEDMEQESEEYQVFIKRVLAKIVSTYKSNPYLKDSREYNSEQRPLVRPSNAMKSIIMSETFNIK